MSYPLSRTRSTSFVVSTPYGSIQRTLSVPDISSYVPSVYRPWSTFYRSSYDPYKMWSDYTYNIGNYYYPHSRTYFYSRPYPLFTPFKRGHYFDYWPRYRRYTSYNLYYTPYSSLGYHYF